MKKVLITGITGMIGREFADSCLNQGWDVSGIARSSSSSRFLNLKEKYKIHRVDITDASNISKVFETNKFDLVVHLAAQAFNSLSWDQEWYTHHVNTFGTINILNATRKYCPEAKILIACSSAQYGHADIKDGPLNENRALKPISPYGVSKATTELIGHQYFTNYGLKVYLPRLFIHVGTGHPPATAIQNFAMQLAQIKKGLKDPIMEVGALSASRDFIDVRDGVKAMMMLIASDRVGFPINICTGRSYSIEEILNMLIKISGLKVKIVRASTLLRPADEKILLGDNTELSKLGFKQTYSIEETLEDVIQDWMNRV